MFQGVEAAPVQEQWGRLPQSLEGVSLGSPVPLLARLTLHPTASSSPNFTPLGHHVANED